MKKFLSIITIALFMSPMVNAASAEDECYDLATEGANLEWERGYIDSNEEYYDSWQEWYDLCNG